MKRKQLRLPKEDHSAVTIVGYLHDGDLLYTVCLEAGDGEGTAMAKDIHDHSETSDDPSGRLVELRIPVVELKKYEVPLGTAERQWRGQIDAERKRADTENAARRAARKVPADQKTGIHLYWVSTPDHAEDWFIFAKSSAQACAYHRDYEGYDAGEAYARFVRGHVKCAADAEAPVHAQVEDLRGLGTDVVVISAESPRVVEVDGVTYAEGTMDFQIAQGRDNEFERIGKGRPNGTQPLQVKGPTS